MYNSIFSSHQWPTLSVQYSAVQATTYPLINFKFHSGSITGILRNTSEVMYTKKSLQQCGAQDNVQDRRKNSSSIDPSAPKAIWPSWPFDSLPAATPGCPWHAAAQSAPADNNPCPGKEAPPRERSTGDLTQLARAWGAVSWWEAGVAQASRLSRGSATESSFRLHGSKAVWFLRNKF